MLVIRSLEGYTATRPQVITIGTFDGVHLGHRVILDRLRRLAQEVDGESVVVSFHPHPRAVLRPEDNTLRLLQTLDEKIETLRAVGIDRLMLLPFTRDFAATPSDVFIRDVLSRTLRAHTIVIGYDHRFGAGRGGGLDELKQAGAELGFSVQEIPAQQIDDANVSSTRIRQALQQGDVTHAARWLGYPYPLTGLVVQGRQLGRTIGVPTANLRMEDPYKLVPGTGIYAVTVPHAGKVWPGMMSIGTNPTVTDDMSIKVEVNLIGFDGDLYGQHLTVQFLKWLRGEEKYDTLDAMLAQIATDREQSLAAFAQSGL